MSGFLVHQVKSFRSRRYRETHKQHMFPFENNSQLLYSGSLLVSLLEVQRV